MKSRGWFRALIALYWLTAVAVAASAVLLNLNLGVDLSTGANLLLTAALVWVTWSYTRATHEMAASQAAQVQLVLDEKEARQIERNQALAESVWRLGIEEVSSARDMWTILKLWFERGEGAGFLLEHNSENLRSRSESLRVLANRFLMLSPSAPSALRPYVQNFHECATEFAFAVSQLCRAISRAQKATNGPVTLADIKASWDDTGGSLPERSFEKLEDGSYGDAVHGAYSSMMKEAMAIVSSTPVPKE